VTDEPIEAAVPATGIAEVDSALAELAASAGMPPAEQVAAYESAHQALQRTLTTIEES